MILVEYILTYACILRTLKSELVRKSYIFYKFGTQNPRLTQPHDVRGPDSRRDLVTDGF